MQGDFERCEPRSDWNKPPSGGSGPPPDLPLPPSRQPPADFGDYQFIELLGRGGFGAVFKVWSLSKCRYEAMKILEFRRATGAELLEAFKREVQRMANVPGAQVAHIYHVGALPDGRPFFTMEYLSGGRLDRYCGHARLSIEDRISLMAEVCDGVDRLHGLNLIHCDLKPGNILVAEDGARAVPKLVDFGLARQLGFKMSPTRGPAGTAQYMSPEQLESHGDDPERGWDIYALGVTLYELLVGDCPIDPPSDPIPVPEMAADHVRRTPIPPLREKLSSNSRARSDELARERRLTVDGLRKRLEHPWLEPVVDKALAKHKDERFATASEMAENLRCYVAGRRPPIVPPTPRDRVVEFVRDHRLSIAIACVVMLVGALGLWGASAKLAARRGTFDALVGQARTSLDPVAAIRIFQEALAVDPTRSDVRLELAGAYALSGDTDTALKLARDISENDPFRESANAFVSGLSQARAPRNERSSRSVAAANVDPGQEYFFSLGLGPADAPLAVDLLTRALRDGVATFDEMLRLRLTLAMRYFQLEDFDSLDSETHWLIDTVNQSAAAWNLRGLACYNKERLEEALASFDKALKINPRYAVVHLNRAELHNQRKEYDLALRDCEQAVKIDPSLLRAVQGTRITALFGNGDQSNARSQCEAIQGTADATFQTRFACGKVWLDVQLPRRAWAEFDQAVKLSEQANSRRDKYLAFWYRAVAASRDDRQAEAIEDLHHAETLQPKIWSEDVNAYRVRGGVYLLDNQPAEAIRDFTEVTRSVEATTFDYLRLWQAYLSTGSTEEARDTLLSARKAVATGAWPARLIGYCLGEVDRDALLRDAGQDDQKKIEAYYYMGLVAKARHDLDDAALCFRACIALGTALRQAETRLAIVELSLITGNR